jgi:hypothetical protein
MKKKLIIIFLTLVSFLQIQCFGKFALTRISYDLVDSISLGGASPILVKFIKSVVMLVGMAFLGGIIFFLDIVIFNLIEFWTDKNVLDGVSVGGKGKALAPGKSVKFAHAVTGDGVTISRSVDGEIFQMVFQKGNEKKEIRAYRSEPGKLYSVDSSGNISPIEPLVIQNELRGIRLDGKDILVRESL